MGETERREALIEFVKAAGWNGPHVLAQCRGCPIELLEEFAAGLKNNTPIPMIFRWASDDDFYADKAGG